ncbi:MAG TPA: HD domain-containing protein [Pseudomonadales bacterium]
MADAILKWDVTGKIPVTDGVAVCDAVSRIVQLVYPDVSTASLRTAFVLHDRIYEGRHPDYHACETGYHDKRHVLDVTLAAARLLHGHEMIYRDSPKERLGADLMRVGILVALFHDVGYIRHREDRKHFHGAQLTKTHVSRGADFLSGLLPLVGFDEYANIGHWLVHYTGYEVAPDDIPLQDHRLKRLGALIGTADIMAQMASDDYLEKCRDELFKEFELGGATVALTSEGEKQVLYSSGEDLLKKTPGFMSKTLEDRLEGTFGGCYRFVEYHFGGRNPYMEAIDANRDRIRKALESGDTRLQNN